MVDIASIPGGIDIESARNRAAEDSRPEEEALRARDIDDTIKSGNAVAANDSGVVNQNRAIDETSTDQSANARGERDTVDQVTLSKQAQEILQARPSVAADEFAPANDTNQQARNEDRTGVVNGNLNNQSSQTRALGQIIDQYA